MSDPIATTAATIKPGFKTSEFWIQLLAHFAPVLAAYILNSVAPSAPWAAAAVGIVATVAGHAGAGNYANARADVKAAALDAVNRAATAATQAAADSLVASATNAQ